MHPCININTNTMSIANACLTIARTHEMLALSESKSEKPLCIKFESNDDTIRDAITTLGIPYATNMSTANNEANMSITVCDTNLIDMLAILHVNNAIPDVVMDKYLDWPLSMPMSMPMSISVPIVKMIKMDPDAVIPAKTRGSDVGYDLTVIKVHKVMSPDRIIMFDSGIQARIPWGTYLEIVPRSSLSKTGWMMANSVGIIDPSYTGNLLVVCIKVDPDAAPLTLPFRGFQIIVRKQHHMTVQAVVEEEEENDRVGAGATATTATATSTTSKTFTTSTTRGSGGFGSTD